MNCFVATVQKELKHTKMAFGQNILKGGWKEMLKTKQNPTVGKPKDRNFKKQLIAQTLSSTKMILFLFFKS